MTTSGWIYETSPFHAGERAVQARLGSEEKMDSIGRRVIRNFMPEQHRQFYQQLPFILVGTVDEVGNPWASVLVGEPGFLSSPSDRHLDIQAQPLFGDPLHHSLTKGIDIGFLGIELHTRRRNRVNGIVTSINEHGFTVEVKQAFGNCPKYIQSRSISPNAPKVDPLTPKVIREFSGIDLIGRSQIQQADTFFIATSYSHQAEVLTSGVDVSHRGGKSGFIRIDGDSLTVPDFTGNCMFNTFGNLELNPRAGLLFIDFNSGDLLYLTGQAEVLWQGPEISAYPGAERLLRFQAWRGYQISAGFPAHWSAPELSPFLIATGEWLNA